jgi:hypothetical protein
LEAFQMTRRGAGTQGILTALPVVPYNPTAIWGPRFITIPLEDFFYNYSLLSFYLLVYRMAGTRLKTPQN